MSALSLCVVLAYCFSFFPAYAGEGRMVQKSDISGIVVVSGETEIYIAPETITNLKIEYKKKKKQKKTTETKRAEVKADKRVKKSSLSKASQVIFYTNATPVSQNFCGINEKHICAASSQYSFKFFGINQFCNRKKAELKDNKIRGGFYSSKNLRNNNFLSFIIIRPPPFFKNRI